jgi:hypothetical protein
MPKVLLVLLGGLALFAMLLPNDWVGCWPQPSGIVWPSGFSTG